MRLSEIASELQRKIELLKQGDLPLNELEKLTDESRELYERLVVIRFKAYDNQVKGIEPVVEETTSAVLKHEESVIPEISFRIEEPKQETPVQVSLIDAIEEVIKSESSTEENTVEEEVSETTAETTHEISADAIEETHTPVSGLQETISGLAGKESLYDKLSKSIAPAESLAQKLEHHPIADLKRAITLNQRFQFSKELFKGNNQDYEVAIEKLNSSNRDEAMKHLESLRSKYAWNNESPVAHDFTDLVERRHQ
jgi:hypothetical protein